MTDKTLASQNTLRALLRLGSQFPFMDFQFHPKGFLSVPHLRFKRLWVGLGAVMVLGILSLSLISIPPDVVTFLWSDKVMHGVAYAALMGWFAQIFRHDLTRLVLVIGFVGLGIAIEYLQALTPTRHFDVSDMVANSCGVVLAWALSYTALGTILERFEGLFQKTPAQMKP